MVFLQKIDGKLREIISLLRQLGVNLYASRMRRGELRRFWRVLVIGAAFLLAAAAAGCTASAQAPAAPQSASASASASAQVTVQPKVSVADQPVQIRVAGLRAGQQATVQVTSTDAAGVQWKSSAVFRADAAGTVDLSSAAALSGSYTGVSGMGLIWSMSPATTPALGAYSWGSAALTFAVSVKAGGASVASGSFQRTFSKTPLTQRDESVSADGFMGQYWHAGTSTTRRPAVLVLDGLPGGMPTLLPAMLASEGYPALGVAYFKEPGLPQTLSDIPLEYFAKALTWLARQPGVDPSEIAVLGISRGSEAAQLLGVYYPALVHGVIASVPSNAANCSYPSCQGPAWTLHGKALPYTHNYDNPSPVDDPKAVIPDQRIDGPVFLDCGAADQAWTSCPYAAAISTLLDAHHDRFSHVLYSYRQAGHGVGSLIPYEPYGPATVAAEGAVSYQADQEGDAALWPHLLSFLGSLGSSR
ncbi:MAG TPA: acyl-CoA thioesterase/bile acid-CoA:amino acid N-acyltransferase family protein [Trebonia sp.]|nr:acyl-CoA thioesterase/bile acid-CoA:amino acid N-acyltransferase family protein [Trebonia sp.]